MTSRLSLALAGDAVALPERRILVLRPPADAWLSDLPGTPVAVQGFKPDHDALAARGFEVVPEAGGTADAAVVFLSRAKALSLASIAEACAAVPEGATVVVDGQKTDGVDSVLRQCRKMFEVGEVFSKAHGKTFSFPAKAAPADWSPPPARVAGFVTRAGVFSADGIDRGSALLADHVGGLSGRVCDLGAGWGYLSAQVLASADVRECTLVEAEHAALACARENVTDPRARFVWADATSWTGGPFDAVVSNPPFHTARRADPALGRAFIVAAARLLAPRGRLLMVANRHLPYEETLKEYFATIQVLDDRDGFKVIAANTTKRQRGRA
ncbi:class I SAM-dependent methyltransferase [Jannaschia marina]|uniref:class I SAM-dependent methyltransferase n=1 Tax=Jannaschia marina TaxID=2741674 RepID=UPI0015CABA73|nr:class I SAM-dependent methyltransferase [Jannaschia marina]